MRRPPKDINFTNSIIKCRVLRTLLERDHHVIIGYLCTGPASDDAYATHGDAEFRLHDDHVLYAAMPLYSPPKINSNELRLQSVVLTAGRKRTRADFYLRIIIMRCMRYGV